MDNVMKIMASPNVSLFLALLSVCVSGLAAYSSIRFFGKYKKDAEEQITNLKNLLNKTELSVQSLVKVEGSITTRSVGSFPDHIPAITRILESAQKEIYIASEGGYGATTATHLYIPYARTIQEKGAKGVTINMLVPDAELMKYHRKTQFDSWEIMAEKEGVAELLLRIKRRLRLLEPIQSFEEFTDALECEENQARSELTRYATMYSVTSLLPVNFWISDNVEAVFAIKSFEDDVFTYAFETRDTKLIEALIGSWHFHKSSPGAKEI